MDYNPLTTPNTVITDALNATFLTYNGNELMLLNDMGNTTIQDATTGNIMGLSPGFVPVGMKEHGGVLYIASYNPQTKEGELGTIPSPLFNYTYDPKPVDGLCTGIDLIKWPSDDKLQTLDITALYNTDYIEFLAYYFDVGELFMLGLTFNENQSVTREQPLHINNIKKWSNSTLSDSQKYSYSPTTFKVLSLYTQSGNQSTILYGMFKLLLYAGIQGTKSYYLLESTCNRCLEYYRYNYDDVQLSTNWFLNALLSDSKINLYNQIDTKRTSSSQDAINKYNTYPNIPEGSLYLKIEPEVISDILFFTNEGISSMFYYKCIKTGKTNNSDNSTSDT